MTQIQLKDTTPGTILTDSTFNPIKFEVVSVGEINTHLKYISGDNYYNKNNDTDLYPFSSTTIFYIPED